MLSDEILIDAHKFCVDHRQQILASSQCGCFYCLAMFPPSAITDWTDAPPDDDEPLNGKTALCAKCGIDSVLPDNMPGIPLTPELLADMYVYWFERTPKAAPAMSARMRALRTIAAFIVIAFMAGVAFVMYDAVVGP